MTNCARCGNAYEPDQRFEFCPHPIKLQLGPGNVPKKLRTFGKLREVVLEEPFWEKQRYESAKNLEKWQFYRELPPKDRSYSAVARRFEVTPTAIAKTARQWKWQVRLEAYELHKDREMLQLEKDERVEAFKRWKDIAFAAQQIGGAKFEEMLATIQTHQELLKTNPDAALTLDISPDLALRFAKEGVMLERLITGESTVNALIETPSMKRERQLRDAVELVHLSMAEWELSHPNAPQEERDAALLERISWAHTDINISQETLMAAILGIPAEDASQLTN